jgi:hypothetical protein
LLSALAAGRRRTVVSLLLDRTSAVDVRELATNLAAAETDQPLVAVPREAVRERRAELVHAHLPALADAGLVEYDGADGTVATTDHPALADPRLREILATDEEGFDAVLDGVADQRRRIVLGILEEHDAAMDRRRLAREVADVESRLDSTPDSVDAVLVSLHHVHLPKLAAVGLIEYDAEAGRVAYEGHPSLAEGWFDVRRGETPQSLRSGAERTDGVRTIAGRSDVLARGRSLIREADEELFLLITTGGLLEPECFAAIEDAAARGVDVYLGSGSEAVRAAVRERAPAVTVWEPRLDWLNLPPERDKLGRLVFADRAAVMLARLDRRHPDGHPRETAITGAGADNTLVVLLRQLLGSRLDDPDGQQADELTEIPL